MTQNSEAEVRELAYHLWVEAGKPAGRDLDFWLAAEQRLTGSAIAVEPPAPAKTRTAKPKAVKAATTEDKPKTAPRRRAKAG